MKTDSKPSQRHVPASVPFMDPAEGKRTETRLLKRTKEQNNDLSSPHVHPYFALCFMVHGRLVLFFCRFTPLSLCRVLHKLHVCVHIALFWPSDGRCIGFSHDGIGLMLKRITSERKRSSYWTVDYHVRRADVRVPIKIVGKHRVRFWQDSYCFGCLFVIIASLTS